MDVGRTLAQIRERITATPPGPQDLLVPVQDIVRQAVIEGAGRGANVRASVAIEGNQLVVRLVGKGATTVRAAVNASIRTQHPQLAQLARTVAVDRLK